MLIIIHFSSSIHKDVNSCVFILISSIFLTIFYAKYSLKYYFEGLRLLLEEIV